MRGPRRGNCGRCEPPPYDGARRPHGGAPARRRARSGAHRRSPDPPGAPSRDARSRAGPIPMLREKTARACCGPCSVSFPGRWGRVNGPTIRIQAYLALGLLVCGCSGGVLLSRSLVGAVPLALGGLASGFGMGPGVSLPRCGRRDGGGVVVLLGVGFPPGGGVGGLVLGCVVDAVGSPGACVAFLSSPLLVRGVAPVLGLFPRVVGGLCGVCSCWPISTGRLSPLPGVHLRPIHPVVCWGPSATPVGVVWRPGLGGGFPLRCFQRLPVPNVANQRCPWRDNWRTRGSSVPVLSYWGRVSSSLLRAQRIGTELSHDVLNPARVPL